MTTLVLVRHAKSDWGDPGLDDHDRPLNGRGLRDAPAMARRLAETGLTLDAIVSSTALRAHTTADFFGEQFGLPVVLDAELYGAPARTLREVAAERAVPALMIVAHDPGMTNLAGDLSDGGIGHMPTCAVATFEWDEPDPVVALALPPDRWRFQTPR